jgi:hypothetical protein
MSIKQVGTIYRDERERTVYLVMEDDGEVYYFGPGSFSQGLTRWADKGCKLTEIERKMLEIEEKTIDTEELGFT